MVSDGLIKENIMAKIYGIIYKATNKVNGKMYIGQTVQPLNRRICGHISRSLNKDSSYFHRAINRYGKENFEWEIIAECNSLEELNIAEIEMIKKHNLFESGYNLDFGGKGSIGFKHLEKTKKKMSESHMGEKNHNYGKVFTKEHKEKLSNSHKDKICLRGKESPIYGRKLSDSHKRKISIANEGRACLEKTKKKISETRINNKSTAKKYIIISPEKEKFFVYGLREFCRNYKKENLDHCNLIKVAKGKLKQHKGYKCRYWEEKHEI